MITMSSTDSVHGDLVVEVAELRRAPGLTQHINRRVHLLGLEIPLARAQGAIELDLLLESELDGIMVVGTVTVDAVLACRRCLTERTERVCAQVHELFSDKPHLLEDDSVYPLAGAELDLEQLVRDAVILALPDSPVCPGACPPDIAGRISHLASIEPAPDPRWAVLSQLRFDEPSSAGSETVPDPRAEEDP
jgi:uncharacterized protein